MKTISAHPLLQRFWPYLAVATAILAVYSGVYGNAFLFDDLILITGNEFLKSWRHVGDIVTSTNIAGAGGKGSFYRPLPELLHLIIWQTFGASTAAFHALNITIHIGTACTLMALGRRLGFGLIPSLVGTLIWALHPVQTESVTYMSGTPDLLFSLCCLLGVLCFQTDRIWLSIVCMIAGLLSKETAIIMPVLAMVAIYATTERHWYWRSYMPTWPLWLTAVTFAALRMTLLAFNGVTHVSSHSAVYEENLYMRIQTSLATLTDYAHMLFWPEDLHMDRFYPVYAGTFLAPVMGGFAILASLLLISVWQRKPGPAAFGAAWFLVALFPNTGILIPLNAYIFEHWLYLPTAGLILGGSAAIASLKAPRLLLLGSSIVIIGALSVATWQQNATWHDPVEFYTRLISLEPISPRAENNLGQAYEERHDFDNAILHYRRALEHSGPYADAQCNLGMSLMSRQTTPETVKEGLQHIRAALQINPRHQRALSALQQVGDWLATHPEDRPKD